VVSSGPLVGTARGLLMLLTVAGTSLQWVAQNACSDRLARAGNVDAVRNGEWIWVVAGGSCRSPVHWAFFLGQDTGQFFGSFAARPLRHELATVALSQAS
jgi:hypothetical protein